MNLLYHTFVNKSRRRPCISSISQAMDKQKRQSKPLSRFGSTLKSHQIIEKKETSAKDVSFFGAEGGTAPLAARPAQRLLIVDFAVITSVIQPTKAKQTALAVWLHPQVPPDYQKKETSAKGCFFFWCRRWDLNPHVVSNNGF